MASLLVALALLGVGFQAPDITGIWKLTDAKVKTNGPREIIIREDSSARDENRA